jgi:hypothetical protein
MPHATLQTTEDIISDILNLVCPECGGPIGGPSQEFKCQGRCRRDWRAVWESSSAKPDKSTKSRARTRCRTSIGVRSFVGV